MESTNVRSPRSSQLLWDLVSEEDSDCSMHEFEQLGYINAGSMRRLEDGTLQVRVGGTNAWRPYVNREHFFRLRDVGYDDAESTNVRSPRSSQLLWDLMAESPRCPDTPDADDPDREAALARIAEREAEFGSRSRRRRSPAPPQWRPVKSDDARPSLGKSLRTVRGRGQWRTTELWELPFPELRKAWNTWLVYRKCGHGPLEWRWEYEFYWWGYWEDFERGG